MIHKLTDKLLIALLAIMSFHANEIYAQKSKTILISDVFNSSVFAKTQSTYSVTTTDSLFTFIVTNAEWNSDINGVRIKNGGTLSVNSKNKESINQIKFSGLTFGSDATLIMDKGKFVDTTSGNYTWEMTSSDSALVAVNQVKFSVGGGDGKYVDLSGTGGTVISYNDVAKKTPYARLAKYEFTQDYFHKDFKNEPNYVVYDDQLQTKNITNRFYVSYVIAGTKPKSTDTYTEDVVTGSKVSRLYGQVTIGNKAGDFKVLVGISPLPKYADEYNTTYTSYTIHVPMVAPIFTLPSDITATVGTVVDLPKITIKDSYGVDLSSYYDLSLYGVDSDGNTTAENNYYKIDDTHKYMTLLKQGTVKVYVKGTPKTGNESTYKSFLGSYNLTISAKSDVKTKPTITFDSLVYNRALTDQSILLPVPTITDSYGNNIGSSFLVYYSIVQPDSTGSSCWTSSHKPGSWYAHIGAWKAGVVTYKVVAVPISESWQGQVVSDIYEKTDTVEFQYKQILRGPEVIVTPKSFKITIGSYMDETNKPTLTNDYNGSVIGGYYTFAFPNDGSISLTGYNQPTGVAAVPMRQYKDADGVQWNEYKVENWNKDGWKMVFLEPNSKDHIVISFYPWDATHYGNGTNTYLVTVFDKIDPVLSLSDTLLVANTNKLFEKPTLSIKDANGVNISKHFDVSYKIDNANGAISSIDATGAVTVGANAGKAKVTITVTPSGKDTAYYRSAVISYSIDIVNSEWTYNIDDTGKLSFMSAGAMTGGTVIAGVPGVSVRFGSRGESSWAIEKNADGTFYSVASPVILNDKEIPTDGTYYAFTPKVNGFITIGMRIPSGHQACMVDVGSSGDTEKESIVGTGSIMEKTFRYPLIVGNTYYLYNSGNGVINNPMELYSVNYEPAWLIMRNDTKSYDKAQAYESSYSGGLPFMLRSYDENVSFTSDNTDVATVNNASLISAVGAGTANISATVITPENSNVKKSKKICISVSDVPTYIVPEAYVPAVNDTMYTKPKSNIVMTFGGWEPGNGDYVNASGSEFIDSWKVAKMDSVGRDSRVIDGFKYATFGSNNAKDENMLVNLGNYDSKNPSTWDLPCRGSFLKFEPKANGRLYVYTIQNGCSQYTGNPEDTIGDSSKKKVKWTAYYIVDEHGSPVDLVSETQTNGKIIPGAYTLGVYRSGKNEIKYSTEELDSVPEHYNLIFNSWGDRDSTQTVITTSDGAHLLISKAYVRYTFDVKAGKTYFMFSNVSKIGFCGYTFNQTLDTTTVSLAANQTSYVPLESDNATVSVYKSFKKGSWNSVCLPFSIQQDQFKSIFGNKARLVSFDSVKNSGDTVMFIKHYYQMIVSGRPYFIYPDTTIDDFTAHHVSIEASATEGLYDSGVSGKYKFVGLYNNQKMPAGSNFVSGKLYYITKEKEYPAFRSYLKYVGETSVSSAKQLTFVYSDATYYDYMMLNPGSSSGGDPSTDILPIVIEPSEFNNIYNLDGQYMGTGETRLSTLPKGIYIINRKKIIIK